MTGARVRYLFWLVLLFGAVARLAAWRWAPPVYPDAYFQYLDPAWTRISGVGQQTWEWRDGIRSWVLPGYHGAWMALLAQLGVRSAVIGDILRIHWALLSLTMVWAAWRGAACMARMHARRLRRYHQGTHPEPIIKSSYPQEGWQAGLAAASLVAAFPLLSLYAIETLTELPSMIGIVCGLAFTAELVERGPHAPIRDAAMIGFVLGLSVCLRVVNGPVALVAPLWLLIRGSRRLLLPMAAAALVPLVVFGIVDRVTWGGYFSSFVAHIKFNVIEGRAAEFGVQPARWYWDKVHERVPVGMWLLMVPALLRIRLTWPFVITAGGLLALISSQPHKEERFMVLFWPLLLIAAGVGAAAVSGARVAAAWPRLRRVTGVLRSAAIVFGILFVIWDGANHLDGDDLPVMSRGRFDAQAWVGRDKHFTGLMIDHIYASPGYLWLGSTLPLLPYDASLLANPVVTHVLAPKDSSPARAAEKAGFVRVHRHDSIVVLRRPEHSQN